MNVEDVVNSDTCKSTGARKCALQKDPKSLAHDWGKENVFLTHTC